MNILQVSTSDVAGGAERSARALADAFRDMGHGSWLAVGHKRSEDPYVLPIPNEASRNAAYRRVAALRQHHAQSARKIRGIGRLLAAAGRAMEPTRALGLLLGHEDMVFPGTRRLLDLPPVRPDILHLHNLHGEYFDLRLLAELSARATTVLNVRDGWLTTGHCAFGIECERWKTGCGHCPDLDRFPAVRRDATAFNWKRKRDALAASRLHVSAPSQWMMNLIEQSFIAPAIGNARVIPNGVNTRIFRPGDLLAARQALSLPPAARVAMVAANGLRNNPWKDLATLRGALDRLGAQRWPWELIVLAVGDTGKDEQIGSLSLRFVPFVADDNRLVQHYRAADLYIHAARVESFGNVLLEARACGTAVVSTATGGIPEQIPSGTGALVKPADPDALAAAIQRLLFDDHERRALAQAGFTHVCETLSLDIQARRFLSWYEELLHA